MLFKDISGNEDVKKELFEAVKKNRIAHAQLFLGSRGDAKLPLSLAFAQYLNCEQKANNDSCNKCHSCQMYNTLSHPDLHFVFPVLKTNNIKNPTSDNFVKNWREAIIKNPYISLNEWYDSLGSENKQGAIYKGEAENIQKKTSLKNFEAAFRIFIFWMPEKMNSVTANKLLKLIEEPPKGTFFFLISENSDQLLPTIISRVQTVKIKKFSNNNIVEYLQKKHNITKEKANKIARIVSGNLSRAIYICKNEPNQNFLKEFQNWMQICYKAKIIEIANFIDKITKIGRENQKVFLYESLRIIRECLLVNTHNDGLQKKQKLEEKFIRNFAPFIHESNSIEIFERLEKAIKNIERNANPKILFYELSLQMMRLLKVKRKFAH